MKTKKQTLTILAGIFLVATMSMLTAQINIDAGNTEFIRFEVEDPIYTVTGNSSNLDGLNITFYNETHAKISLHKAYKPDNFTIHFISESQITEHNHHHHGGGGGTNVVYKDNETIKWNNNTEEIEFIPDDYVNKSELDLNKSDQPEEPKDERLDLMSRIFFFLGGALVTLLGLWLIRLKFNSIEEENEKKRKDPETTDAS